jgi:hypothetical protein
MKFADTFAERRFLEDGEHLTFSFLCDDMQLSYYGPLWSPFNLLMAALQRQNAKNLKQIFPEKEYRGLSPNFHIHVSVSE